MKHLFFLLLLSHITFANPLEPKPHPVPKLTDLEKPWVFARASEASTLFIDPEHKGKEPYAHIIKLGDSVQWFEFDGNTAKLWKISKHETTDKELTLHFEGGGKVLLFPYWDIDNCLLIIRFSTDGGENPTRFSVPYKHLSEIEYMKE